LFKPCELATRTRQTNIKQLSAKCSELVTAQSHNAPKKE